MTDEVSIAIALLAIRLLAGILFFFQGYDKLFSLKTEGVLRAFADSLLQRKIPLPLARISIQISSFIEFAGGLLLVFGLFREPVLYFLTANMLCVAFTFSFLKPMWDMNYFFSRFVLLAVLLLLPAEWDNFSLAHLFSVAK